MSKPFLRVKASAALDGLPSVSKAIFAGGPQAITSLTGVCSASCSTTSAKRRGVAEAVMASDCSCALLSL